MKRFLSLIMLFVCLCNLSTAQTTPFLTDDEIRMLANEISGDRAFEHIRVLSRWHRNSGMEGYFKAADYVVEAAKTIGLEDVKFIEQTMDGRNYTARSAELWMVEPVEVKLADIGDHAVYLADGSSDADVTAELVWIPGVSKSALAGLDLTGKIVLTDGSPGGAVTNAVYGEGAVGVVSYQTSEGRNPLDVPDQIAWRGISSEPPAGKKATFAFVLPPRKGDALRRILASDGMQDILGTGKKTKGGRIVLRAKVDTEFGDKPGRTGFVEGWIKGSTYRDQQIVITAHLQEEQGSANDDGSGCASILEIARAYIKLINEGKIPRPLRDIRFWWTDEISSEYTYFREHPEETKKLFANIHQDMVGANQAMGSRVQHLILAPHSRTSYLDAIFESIGTFVINTNNAFLAASRQGGLPRPFTRPIYSTRGSRQGYNARFVPYFGSSDHMTFVDGIIGVPAVATINWDDDYIHSSDDDLFQIDQTQLQRNAFLMGATAFVVAYGDERIIPKLCAETFSQGEHRLANDLRVAMEFLNSPDSGDGWKEASMMIEQGVKREVRALTSIQAFAKGQRTPAGMVENMTISMRGKENDLMEDLRTYYVRLHGNVSSPVVLAPAEQAAAAKIPVNVKNIGAYYDGRDKASSNGWIHGLMREEVFNFVDGERSMYDIYKAVRAEALAAGSWYYGDVSLEVVVELLQSAVEAGAMTLR